MISGATSTRKLDTNHELKSDRQEIATPNISECIQVPW